MPPGLVNAFTVDVEDYFHVSAFESQIHRGQWDSFKPRVVDNTHRVLDLLARFEVKATFFVLGWVAERFPKLVERIHEAGHEIGSHGHWHRLIYKQTPEEFRRDLRQSREVLEAITGEPVRVYRAPSFSVTARSTWALAILVEEGFQIDSSVFPIRHDRYGMPAAPRAIHRISTPSGPLWECPPPVVRCACFRLPVGGGGYLRLYPIRWTCNCLARINRREKRPFVVYVHPWELDPDQPRVRGASRLLFFPHYINLSRTAAKIEALLGRFQFGPLRHVIDHRSREQRSELAGPDVASANGRAPHEAALGRESRACR